MSKLFSLILCKSSDLFSLLLPESFVQFSEMSCLSSIPLEWLHVRPWAYIHSQESPPPHIKSLPHTSSKVYRLLQFTTREQLKTPSRLPSFHSKLSQSCLVLFLSKWWRAIPTWPHKIPFAPGSSLVQPTILPSVKCCPEQCCSDSSHCYFCKG